MTSPTRRSFLTGLLSLIAVPPYGGTLPPAGGAVKVQAMSLYGVSSSLDPATWARIRLHFNSIYGKMGRSSLLAARHAFDEAHYAHLRARVTREAGGS